MNDKITSIIPTPGGEVRLVLEDLGNRRWALFVAGGFLSNGDPVRHITGNSDAFLEFAAEANLIYNSREDY
jgi:hypothetical protein